MHEVQLHDHLPRRHIRPSSLDAAVAVLAEHGQRAKVIAGGTDLILEFHRGLHPDVDVLVDVSGLPGLDRVELSPTNATIGALVTHGQVADHAGLIDRALPLAQACREIGSPQLRNRATVVGNLVTASPANDTITALRTLDAELVVVGPGGERVVPLAGFHHGVRRTGLAPEELVTHVRFRLLTADERGVFVKAGNRVAQAISVVHAAIVLDTVADRARVAVGSVAPTIVEFELAGPFTDDLIGRFAAGIVSELTPIDDVRATARYRSHAVSTIVTRGLTALRDGSVVPYQRPPALAGTPTAHRPSASLDLGPDDTVTALVNGQTISAPGVGTTLLDWLRDFAGPSGGRSLTGTKEGCAEGECGACTVILNGAAVMACLVPAGSAAGGEISTVEAVGSSDLDPLQQAFVDHGAVQCGFCIPGFIVAGRALLDEIAHPTHEQIEEALGGNLCRCTGYYKIIDAIAATGALP